MSPLIPKRDSITEDLRELGQRRRDLAREALFEGGREEQWRRYFFFAHPEWGVDAWVWAEWKKLRALRRAGFRLG